MKRKRWSVFLAALALCVFFLTGTVSAAFQDVAAESPYASAVAEMEAQGLLSGYPDGRFYPARTISAAQFVTIAARCAGLEPGRGLYSLPECSERVRKCGTTGGNA